MEASDQAAAPEVSVIVPHYDDLASLEKCIASLLAPDFPVDRREIIVCDNDSLPRGTIEVMLAGRASLVVQPVKGAGPARNRGVEAARGNKLAFIDCDCIADPAWLTAGVAALADADVIGGRVTVFSDVDTPTGADIFERIFAFDQQSYVEKKQFTVTANLFTRRDVFERVGPFAVGVSEDVEWSRRAVAKGFRLRYAHDAVVSHPTRPDWPALRHKWKRMVREEFLTRRQAGRSRTTWLARQALVAASPLVHTGRVLGSPFSLAERLRGVGALWRLRWWRAVEGVRVAIENPAPQAILHGRDES